MKALVTGSSGHLGEALVRVLREAGHTVIGLDIKPSPTTDAVGSITDRGLVSDSMHGVGVVLHTATLHKPHVATHSKQDFVDTNVSGSLALLEASVDAGAGAFVFTSTTSVYGHALRPPAGEPAVWVTEELAPIPKNIYGVTKLAAENLCQLFHRKHDLNCVVLRTSRFFPEEDDDRGVREAWSGENAKANEILFRRADLADMVSAHLAAAECAPDIGFGRYIISATSPFSEDELAALRSDLPSVLRGKYPHYESVYERLGWHMFDSIDRVYVNEAARRDLGWEPQHNFDWVLEQLQESDDARSPLAREVGSKGYHDVVFEEGPYPVD